MFAYAHFCLQVTLDKHRKLHPADPTRAERHQTHTHTPQATSGQRVLSLNVLF